MQLRSAVRLFAVPAFFLAFVFAAGAAKAADVKVRISSGFFHVYSELKPAFVGLIKGSGFIPHYAKVVSATPQAILDKAAADAKARAA